MNIIKCFFLINTILLVLNSIVIFLSVIDENEFVRIVAALLFSLIFWGGIFYINLKKDSILKKYRHIQFPNRILVVLFSVYIYLMTFMVVKNLFVTI
jgi:hypothetical protein